MKNIATILKDAGVEITPEVLATVEKAVTENYKTVAEFEKQGEKLKTATEDLTKAKDDIKNISTKFEGKTAEEWKAELDTKTGEWQKTEDDRKQAEEDAKKDAEMTSRFSTATGEQKYRDELTEKAILAEFKKALAAEENKGKGDAEILTALTKDKGYFLNPQGAGATPPIPGAKGDTGKPMDEARINAIMGLKSDT